MKESKKGKGVGSLLIAQLLLGVLIYIAVTVYPIDPKIALILIYILILGILYFSWRGLKRLWRGDLPEPSPRGRDKKS
ncbi:MAG TPA: hypothetical protein VFA47_01290 [Candidatus Manganitrophaceae bacterium]|nr:hypothetical protein [Candidatus Manganitrophaceae bacterium]